MAALRFRTSSEFNNYARAFRLGGMETEVPCLDIAVFGSTQILNALDFRLFPEVNAENFAFEVQSFLYDGLLLRRFAGNIRKGGKVIFGVAPFNFLLWDLSPSMLDSYRFRRYYFMCGPDFHPNCSESECRRIVGNFRFRQLLHRLVRMKYRGRLDALRDDGKVLTPEMLEKDAGKKAADFRNNFFLAPDFRSAKDEAAVEKNIAKLCENIGFAQSSGLDPVILIAPNAPELLRLVDPEILDRFLWRPLEIVRQKSGIEILNFMEDPQFSGCENFRDALSLSKTGRTKFTSRLIKQIESRKIC